jgi:hypothetical protein
MSELSDKKHLATGRQKLILEQATKNSCLTIAHALITGRALINPVLSRMASPQELVTRVQEEPALKWA